MPEDNEWDDGLSGAASCFFVAFGIFLALVMIIVVLAIKC